MERRYCGLLPPNCRQLLGPHFALLRPDFAQARRSLAPRRDAMRRILVCFGGSDPTNETAKALAAIKSQGARALEVDVAIGISNPNAASVAEMCRQMPLTTLHRGAENMAELMSRADLAIGAGGVMCWERCCLGLPTIALDIAPNQVGALTALAAAGALDYLGSSAAVTVERIASSLAALLTGPARLRAMSEAATAQVDGLGTGRVAGEMLSLLS
jgi:spore coat polysaccharide biosynthesis predicted glycosyltransferase SpsG